MEAINDYDNPAVLLAASIHLRLDVVGFHIPAQRELIMQAGLADYEAFSYLVEKDIRDLAEEFSARMILWRHSPKLR